MDQVLPTRERIVATAMKLFAVNGYNATSIADILSSAQVGSGSLYYFFPGKQDVLLAVLEAYRDGIGPMLLEPSWRDVEDPIERIFALLGSYRSALELSECSYGCPIGSLALELHEPEPTVREMLAQNFAAWTSAVEASLRAAAVGLPTDQDPAALAEFVLVVMEGAVMQARTHRDLACFDRAVTQLHAYFAALGLITERNTE